MSEVTLAQEQCGTMHLSSNQHFVTSGIDNHQVFEKWLTQKFNEKRLMSASARLEEQVYHIPVVVHIIHNGQALGEGVNIPRDQVLSQIDILNEDYRKLNEDTTQTFDPFKATAADTKIQFELAVRDPEGLPTTGIVRVQGFQNSYSLSQAEDLAALSTWPSDSYLNIWVTNLSSGLLGYAQFPVSNEPGLDIDRTPNPLTDGVVIDYEYFGTGFNTDDFSQGRTATHEIGHYFGLRHIWGDGGCNADDFCDDTPQKEGSTSGCPESPTTSCGSLDMNQNFMDYTDDVCMSLFTFCQKERMRLVLENSPRRKSLLVSKALDPVELVPDDLGIREVVQLYGQDCGQTLTPEFQIRNYGTNNITQYVAQLFIDEELVDTKFESSINLSSGAVSPLIFDDLPLPEGTYSVRMTISSVNGNPDQNLANNSINKEVSITPIAVGEIISDFEAPSPWLYADSSVIDITGAPTAALNNQAIVFNFFESEQDLGTFNILESPIIRLNPLSIPRLDFRYAYNHPEGNHADALFIMVSTDCGLTYSPENLIFSSYGSGLNSVGSLADEEAFIPRSNDDWRDFSINLSSFKENEFIRIGFFGQNGLGNNLFLDDIIINAGPNPEYDVALQSINNVPLVSCASTVPGTIEVVNNGNQTVNGFALSYFIDGIFGGTLDFPEVTINSQNRHFADFIIDDLLPGEATQLTFVANIESGFDEVSSNDTINKSLLIDNTEISLPYRAIPSEKDWKSLSQSSFRGWVSNEDFYFIELRQNPALNEDFLLISPLIKTTNLRALGLGYESAYALRPRNSDELQILADINCNGIFAYELASYSDQSLRTASFEDDWVPSSAEDWSSEFIDLSFLSAVSEEIRIAFKVKNRGGSTLWLRNIELFENNEPPISIEDAYRIYPNPANDEINIRFNLLETQAVNMQLISLQGKVIYDQTFEQTLNQTLTLRTAHENNGIYLLKITGKDITAIEKVIIWH